MEIKIDGGTTRVDDGTLAVFIDPSGKVLWVGLARGDQFQNAMTQTLGDFDPSKSTHTEVEFKSANVPPTGSTLSLQQIDKLRVCRDPFGNVVRCPPR